MKKTHLNIDLTWQMFRWQYGTYGTTLIGVYKYHIILPSSYEKDYYIV